MKDEVLKKLEVFFDNSTSYGLFPIVAYSLDGNNLLLLTTNIPDLALAFDVLKDATGQEYDLGHYVPTLALRRAAQDNPHVFVLHETNIPGLNAELLAEIGRVVSIFGAPFFRQKGFALVDICHFSRLSHADQLSQLYSLQNVLGSSIRRAGKFCGQLRLATDFGRASTGDGFYVWHNTIGGHADVAVFVVLVCMMAQTEAMRQKGFQMRLKSAFVIDSAFMLYDPEVEVSPHAVPSNAVGAATNGAARLVASAKPGQLLLGDFFRPGQPSEVLSPEGLVRQANELFRLEGYGPAGLKLEPDSKVRVVDKHEAPWYCWNVTGEVPNLIGDELLRVKVGLEPDDARELSEIRFKSSA